MRHVEIKILAKEYVRIFGVLFTHICVKLASKVMCKLPILVPISWLASMYASYDVRDQTLMTLALFAVFFTNLSTFVCTFTTFC